MIYRVSDLHQVASIRGLSVWNGSFSPDNQLVLLPSNQEDHVRLWSMATFQDVAILPHAGGPRTVCFSGDGRKIATATFTSVCLWDLGGLKEKRVLTGHQGGVSAIEFGPGGTWPGVHRRGPHDARLGRGDGRRAAVPAARSRSRPGIGDQPRRSARGDFGLARGHGRDLGASVGPGTGGLEEGPVRTGALSSPSAATDAFLPPARCRD